MDKYIELKRILKKNRKELPNFLQNNGSYKELKECLIKIEEYYQHENMNSIRKLLLGEHGNESNKQQAIYELPTKELIESIHNICKMFNITIIEEMCAGLGLISKMLELNTNLNINTTDSYTWLETINGHYKNVIKKNILEYISEENTFENKLILISWITRQQYIYLSKLIEIKKPKYLMIIGNIYDKDYKIFTNKMNNMEYTEYVIPIKQISYRDYYKENIYFPNNCNHSNTTIYIRNSNVSHIDIINNIGYINLNKMIRKYTSEMYLQDLCIDNVISKWIYKDLNNLDYVKLGYLIIDISYLLTHGIIPPKYITNYDDFEFFMKIYNNFPKLINNYSKFKEYKNLIEQLNNNGLNLLKNNNIIPNWIDNIEECKMYIWLDFSVTDKKWKINKNKFMNYASYYNFIF